MYDYFLGGGHNFGVDRDLAAQVLTRSPITPHIARANRAFLGRAVRWCVAAGYHQFLDLGSGIPTMGNVHEIAHAHNPVARVAYVDHDPVAVAHSRAVLDGQHRVTITEADLRQPAAVLASPGVTEVIDLSEPVVLLTVAVFHFMDQDDDPAGVVARYRQAMAPGSAIVLSHGSADHDDPADAEPQQILAELYRDSTQPVVLRDRPALRRILAGFTPIEPGLVDLTRWRPDTTTPQPATGAYGRLHPRHGLLRLRRRPRRRPLTVPLKESARGTGALPSP